MRGAPAAVMAGDVEAVVTERRHHLDLVLRHRPERVVDAVGFLRRGRAVAVAAQVGGDDMELLGQSRRDLVPGHMGQRVAVQQQQRRAIAAMAQANRAPLVSMSVSVKPGMISMAGSYAFPAPRTPGSL